jgi:uncharacterized protein YcfJ
MKSSVKCLFAVSVVALAAQAQAEVTFYEKEGFQGRNFTTAQRVGNMERVGFDNIAKSVVVVGQRWQVCEGARFDGRCTVLRPGQYPSLEAMGLNERVSSVRPLQASAQVDERDYAPLPVVAQDYRRRREERLFDAQVTSARAVVGTPGQRCWMEREQVVQHQPQQQSNINVPGAAIGAVIGGILGHQVGGGTGKQIATVGGVVGGAALGSQVGGGSRSAVQPISQDVRRCDSNPVQATPAYWDVTYQFRGQEHRVQMAKPPGPTISVNRNGEPRA